MSSWTLRLYLFPPQRPLLFPLFYLITGNWQAELDMGYNCSIPWQISLSVIQTGVLDPPSTSLTKTKLSMKEQLNEGLSCECPCELYVKVKKKTLFLSF